MWTDRGTRLAGVGLLIAAFLLALADAMRVGLSAGPAQGVQSLTILFLLGALSLVAVVGLPGLLVLWLRPRKGPIGLLVGLQLGLVLGLLLHLGVRALSDPPPFQERPRLFDGSMSLGLALFSLSLLVSRRSPIFGAVGVVCVFLVLGKPSDRRPPLKEVPKAGARNLLLVTLDTTRADHTSAFGGPSRRSPHIDAVAAEGVRFDAAFAPIAVTGPSHTTLLSGLGPWSHGSLLNGVPVPEGLPMLAPRLREAGYETGAFVSAYVLDGGLGFSRGFGVYDDDFTLLPGWADTLAGRTWALGYRHLWPDDILERRGDRTVARALSWLEEQEADRPYFLWVHLFDPHGPYAPPQPWDHAYYEGDPYDPTERSLPPAEALPPYLRDSLRGVTDLQWPLAQYAGEISYADAQLGVLLAAIEARGDTDRTLVIVAADHGESLGEHGVWFNHGDDLFEATTRVPLALRLPGVLPAGKVVTELVELGDVAPTVYDLLELPEPETVEGRSLVPLAFGRQGRPFARGLCFDREANLAARARGLTTAPTYRLVTLRTADQRYVWREAPGFGEAVYDRATDPREEAPRMGTDAEVGALRAVALEMVAGMGAAAARSAAEPDAETREKLEKLGYLQ